MFTLHSREQEKKVLSSEFWLFFVIWFNLATVHLHSLVKRQGQGLLCELWTTVCGHSLTTSINFSIPQLFMLARTRFYLVPFIIYPHVNGYLAIGLNVWLWWFCYNSMSLNLISEVNGYHKRFWKWKITICTYLNIHIYVCVHQKYFVACLVSIGSPTNSVCLIII